MDYTSAEWKLGSAIGTASGDAVVFVREDAQLLVESNAMEPFGVLAAELDDIEDDYGPPACCKC